MATRKTVKKISSVTKRPSVGDKGFLSQIKWGESYTSLFLGAVVVIVALVLVFSFIKSKNAVNKEASSSSTVNVGNVNKEQGKVNLPVTYVVKQGDDLWHIAQNLYGSGYNWIDLANANKLENPSMVYTGTKLIVPDVKSRLLTNTLSANVQEPNSITGVSYKIVKGDSLWWIAVRAYGNGYKWVEIAKANNLVNPDLIYSGNILRLPR